MAGISKRVGLKNFPLHTAKQRKPWLPLTLLALGAAGCKTTHEGKEMGPALRTALKDSASYTSLYGLPPAASLGAVVSLGLGVQAGTLAASSTTATISSVFFAERYSTAMKWQAPYLFKVAHEGSAAAFKAAIAEGWDVEVTYGCNLFARIAFSSPADAVEKFKILAESVRKKHGEKKLKEMLDFSVIASFPENRVSVLFRAACSFKFHQMYDLLKVILELGVTKDAKESLDNLYAQITNADLAKEVLPCIELIEKAIPEAKRYPNDQTPVALQTQIQAAVAGGRFFEAATINSRYPNLNLLRGLKDASGRNLGLALLKSDQGNGNWQNFPFFVAFINANPDFIDVRDERGWTLAMVAIEKGELWAVGAMIDGLNPNQTKLKQFLWERNPNGDRAYDLLRKLNLENYHLNYKEKLLEKMGKAML